MTTGQLLIILLLVLVVAGLVWLLLRRGAARRDEHRVEAETLRSEADGVAATMEGQQAFAEQAEDRALLARAEAEEAARQAARVETEADEQRRAAEQTRQEYEAMMRRADDIDPDVKESEFPPVPDDAGPQPAEPVGVPSGDRAEGGEPPRTRAERRRAREEAEAREESAWASGPAAPVAGAAAAAAVGTAAWAGRRDEDATDEEVERSARIASAADYRDDTDAPAPAQEQPPSGAESASAVGEEDEGVWTPTPVGTGEGMSQTPSHDQHDTEEAHAPGTAADASADAAADAESPQGEWGGPSDASGTDEPAGADSGRTGISMVAETDDYAATEPVLAEDSTPPIEPKRPADAATGLLGHQPGEEEDAEEADSDLPAAGSTSDPGAHPDDVSEPGTEAVILSDADPYASTEPVLADGSHLEAREQAAVSPGDDAEDEGPGESVLEPGEEADAPASEVVEEPTEERYDPTPEQDWAADEGALLEENRERGDALAADRAALDDEAARTSSDVPSTEESRSEEHEPEESAEQEAVAEPARTRRVSEFHEIRDGGYGMGSAATIEDGAQPMDHPVAAYRDTMTFRSPGDPGYDDTEPDVWFYDEGAAERSGFRRSEG